MFCPNCGLEDKLVNQFCRACGADLRNVHNALARPDAVTDSAITARGEIGRAFAAKIREVQTTHDLKKVAEDVLPQIEKFLESPQEKRLRRMRVGTILSSIGLGAAIAFMTIFTLILEKEIIFIAGLGAVLFFIGLSFIANALLFTVPKKTLSDKSADAENQRSLDAAHDRDRIAASVTEHTTRHLKEKQPTARS